MTHRYVRTERHPAVDELAQHGLEFDSFDDRYDAADGFDDLYRGIADELVAAAGEHRQICYAVPGSPGVAERTVGLLREAEARGDITLEMVPGHLVRGPRVVAPRRGSDGRRAPRRRPDLRGRRRRPRRADARRSLHQPAGAVRRQARAARGAARRRAGHRAAAARSPDGARLHGAARGARPRRRAGPPHLGVRRRRTATAVAGEFAALVALSERLRAPGGCPWDAEQTHHSLARYLLEEAYETVEAIEALPADAPDGSGARGGLRAGSRTSSATCCTRWCSTRCSHARRARSRSPTSRAACTTSSCAGTRTSSATWLQTPSPR